MLDVKMVRGNPDEVRAALSRRGPGGTASLDEFLAVEAERRRLVTATERCGPRATRSATRSPRKKRGGEPAEAQIAAMKRAGRRDQGAPSRSSPPSRSA